MSDLQKIKHALGNSFRELDRLSGVSADIEPTTDPGMLVRYWGCIAIDFLFAARALSMNDLRYFRPILQLAGHGIECSFKAHLAGAGVEPPRKHDLIALAELSEDHGLVLDQRDAAAIVHLNHFYAEDLSTGTRFKARYPTRVPERWGGCLPNISELERISWSMIENSCRRVKKSPAAALEVLTQYRENISKVAELGPRD